MFTVVVMDKGNAVAEGGLEAAMKYLDKNSGAKIGKKSAVEVEGEEAYVTVEKGKIISIVFSPRVARGYFLKTVREALLQKKRDKSVRILCVI